MEGEWKRGNANEEDGRGTMWEEKWREGRGREGVKAVGRPLLALRAVGRPLVKDNRLLSGIQVLSTKCSVIIPTNTRQPSRCSRAAPHPLEHCGKIVEHLTACLVQLVGVL